MKNIPVLLLTCFSLAALCLVSAGASAQEQARVVSNALLDSLVDKNIIANKALDGMPGFRIQIYSDSDRKGAQEARTRFLQLYPDQEAYLIYHQPYFKVRAGDFRSRLEAHAMYKKLQAEFDKVFIVPDKINFPKL